MWLQGVKDCRGCTPNSQSTPNPVTQRPPCRYPGCSDLLVREALNAGEMLWHRATGGCWYNTNWKAALERLRGPGYGSSGALGRFGRW